MLLHNQDSHTEYLNKINHLLQEGVHQKMHPFHWASFASLDADKAQLRTVILREWCLERRTLIFHTDMRSPKIKQLKANPNCAIMFYSQQHHLQLRFQASAHIHSQDELASYHYQQLHAKQLAIYQAEQAPSTAISDPNSLAYTADAQPNFAVIVCNFDTLDLLHLDEAGHRRILYDWDRHSEISSQERVP